MKINTDNERRGKEIEEINDIEENKISDRRNTNH